MEKKAPIKCLQARLVTTRMLKDCLDYPVISQVLKLTFIDFKELLKHAYKPG